MASFKVIYLLWNFVLISVVSSDICKYTATEYYTCPKSRDVSFQTSHSSCRRRWFRRRCSTSYGTGYKRQTYYESCTRVKAFYGCCSGWSGTDCSTHNKFPVNTKCPPSQILRCAFGERTVNTTWEKPTFTEPENFELSIVSTYGRESGTFSWGSHDISYTAKSSNNNKETTCSFVIKVIPPSPKLQIRYYDNNEDIEGMVGEVKTLECFVEYTKPAMQLRWTLDGVDIEGSYESTMSDYDDYSHSKNVLTLNLTKEYDYKILKCIGSNDRLVLSAQGMMRIEYEVDPIVDFCPSDVVRYTSQKTLRVAWSEPTFLEMREEPLDITNSLPDGTTSIYTFPLGNHTIEYTATNPENLRKATCTFHIIVRSRPCPTPVVPTDGALVCGDWKSSFTQICLFLCESSKDILEWTSDLYVCGAKGEWMPKIPATVTCAGLHPFFENSLSARHYYDGQCTENSAEIKDSFRNIIMDSSYRIICEENDCTDASISVKCD